MPTWWRLDGVLEISGGTLTHVGSSFDIAIEDADGTAICSAAARVAETDTLAVIPEPELLTWWHVTLGDGVDGCDGVIDLAAALPEEIWLGVGELHPELEAAAVRASGLPESGVSSLNGVYAKVEGAAADTWVFGYAGPSDAWSGSTGPATVTPLQDGPWELVAAYSFPL